MQGYCVSAESHTETDNKEVSAQVIQCVCQKPVVVYNCNPSTREMERRGSRVKESLDCIRPYQKKEKNEREGERKEG